MLLGFGKKRVFAVRSLGVVALAVLIATAVAVPNGRLRWRYDVEDLLQDGAFRFNASAKFCELVQKELEACDPSRAWSAPTMDGGTLIVETTLAGHCRLKDLLGQFRRAKGLMLTVESGTSNVEDNFLEEIGVDFGGGNASFFHPWP